MALIRKELQFPSSNNNCTIFARVFAPADKNDVKAVLQLAHGMAEHSLRYTSFAEYMANAGFAVCVNDHLGHGKSVSKGQNYGYFGERKGWQHLVEDMNRLRGLMQKEYPNVPYCLMGHSMGSFLSRAYTEQHGEGLRAVAFLGTSAGLSPLEMAVGERFAGHVVKKKGSKAIDKTLQKLTTGGYNKKFEPARTENDWLSRDADEVDLYCADPLCGFPFTASGYRDLIRLLRFVNRKEWFAALPDIPILLLSGEDDPVGGFGKGVKKVSEKLRQKGYRVTLKLYPGGRHEMLNEINKNEVYREIRSFFDKAIS